jgi:hypothetical protein
MKQNHNTRQVAQSSSVSKDKSMMERNSLKQTASPTDPIAVAAFKDWLQAGRPAGRDEEFWRRAEARIHAASHVAANAAAPKNERGASNLEAHS